VAKAAAKTAARSLPAPAAGEAEKKKLVTKVRMWEELTFILTQFLTSSPLR
jgi:hypothetical protein